MKKLAIVTILFLIGLHTDCQCLNGREEYENYFNKNISTLNPIEGFWNCRIRIKGYINNVLSADQSVSQYAEWAIIKEGSVFRACKISGGSSYDDIIKFTPTVNSNIFFLEKMVDGEFTTAKAIMTSDGVLEYSYKTGKSEIKIMFPKNIPGLEVYQQFVWIKTFPTDKTPITKPEESPLPKQKGSGSGFALSSNGLIATCYHVIENSDKIVIRGVNSDFNKTYKAKIIVTDKNNDLAIIQIDDSSFKTLGNIPYGLTEKTIDAGSSVFALGYPLRSTMGDEIKLTNGIISSKSGFKGDITRYQISVPVQPGNSGGPLFDSEGNVVGIISAKNILAENAAYAIKSNYLKDLIENLSNNLNLTTKSTIGMKSLADQVKTLKKFIYIIETN